MTRQSLSSYMRRHLGDVGRKKEPGPYMTISRQYGCDGYELGRLLVERLNERDEQKRWKLYYREILRQLAEDAGLTEEIIEKERLAGPSLVKDFMRGLRHSVVPDGYEIRKAVTLMVRTTVFEGYAVIIGQGGTAAAAGIDNGLSIRIEAPKDWRLGRVGTAEQLSTEQAAARMEEIEVQRRHLRQIYERQNPREPAFNLIFDNSTFTKEQILEQILLAAEQKNLTPKINDLTGRGSV